MIPNTTIELNHCGNATNDSQSVDEYLQQLQDKTNLTLIPAVIMMSVFAVTGLVGNILVLVVYSKKFRLNPTKVLIMTIASFDLVSNVGAIPSEVNIMFDSWNFKSAGVCKSKVFLGAFTTVGGAISLLVVAVIRYRKVCRPHGWQVSIRQSIVASGVTAFIAFLFSIPYIIIYGVRTRKTPCPNMKGYECFADDEYFYTIYPLLNNILFFLLFLSLSVSMVVLYILIGVTAWRHSKKFVPLQGNPASAARNQNKGNSQRADEASCSSNVSSSDKERIVSTEQLSVPKSRTKFSSLRMQVLCCTSEGENHKEKPNCQGVATTQQTATTSDSDTANKSVETTNSELSVAGNGPSSDTFENNGGGSEFLHNEYSNAKEGSVSLGHQFKENSSKDPESSMNHKQEISILESKQSQQNTKVKHSKSAITIKKGERRRPLGRMTAMLIIITAIFVLGFVPFLSLTTYKNRVPEKYASLSMAQLTVFNLFYRLYFINSAANPIIYSFCDINFRRECFRLLACRSRQRYT